MLHGALLWILLVAGALACESTLSEARDPLADCQSHRQALCLRFVQCLGKQNSWLETCLAQQDQLGGSCATMIATHTCFSSQSVQLASCASQLPERPCAEICKEQGELVICASPCKFVCSIGNSGLDD